MLCFALPVLSSNLHGRSGKTDAVSPLPASPTSDMPSTWAYLISLTTGQPWLIFVTGVGADGRRYRLADPYSLATTFTGTAWDWLTASD